MNRGKVKYSDLLYCKKNFLFDGQYLCKVGETFIVVGIVNNERIRIQYKSKDKKDYDEPRSEIIGFVPLKKLEFKRLDGDIDVRYIWSHFEKKSDRLRRIAKQFIK